MAATATCQPPLSSILTTSIPRTSGSSVDSLPGLVSAGEECLLDVITHPLIILIGFGCISVFDQRTHMLRATRPSRRIELTGDRQFQRWPTSQDRSTQISSGVVTL